MIPFIFDLLDIAQLSSGRRVSLYDQWKPLLADRGQARTLAYLERARAHDAYTKTLEYRWATQDQTNQYDAQAHALDTTIDQILGGMHDVVSGQMRGLARHEPLYETAAEFLATIFPDTVAAITKLPFVEQVPVVEIIVNKLATTLAPSVTLLGLGPLAARLTQTFPLYRDAVNADLGRIKHEQVREANRRGLAYLAELLFMILGEYHDSDDPAHMDAREELLAPLLLHDARARADWRARRRGQPVSDPAPDAPPPAPDTPPDPAAAPDPSDPTPAG